MLVNGKETRQIDATDRGLHYGDGLFETIAVINGQPLFWREHIERLYRGCERLSIPAPEAALLLKEALQLCTGSTRAVLKVIVTRGSGGRGYRPPPLPQPNRIIAIYPWPDYPQELWEAGIVLRYCSTPLACNPVLAGIKHLNRLEQVVARTEWDDEAISEGLMMNHRGEVIEGTQSNLFMVKDGRLYTPDLEQCGVAGIMRRVILKQAGELGIDIRITSLNREALAQADEIFVCNSIIGIWPVRQLEQISYNPGPLTARLSRQVNEIMGM